MDGQRNFNQHSAGMQTCLKYSQGQCKEILPQEISEISVPHIYKKNYSFPHCKTGQG
jgi:hypothetical protein